MKILSKLGLLILLLSFGYNIKAQRITSTINSNWKYHQGEYEGVIFKNFDDSEWENVNLPHTWNIEDIRDDIPGYHRGISWYRKELILNESLKNKRIILFFEAASIKAEIYVNGKFVNEHLGAYTAFSFDITDFIDLNQKNLIAVKVDNSFNKYTPPLSGDFSMSGGIYRDVYIIALNQIHFNDDEYSSNGIYITTPEVSSDNASIKIIGKIDNDGNSTKKVIVKNTIIDKEGKEIASSSQNITINPGSSLKFESVENIKNQKLWSPEDPYLYKVNSQILDESSNEILDEVSNPLGFRWFSVDAKKGFFLNGKHYKLNGAARHQDYEGIGIAVPNELHRKDMQLLKDMGANFVRISHYPQDPEIYKACDELGLIVWSEIPIVNEITLSDTFFNNCILMLKEMIYQNFNHPSIMMWGYMNEVFGAIDWFWEDKPDEEKELYKKETARLANILEKVIRESDPDRLSVIAFHTEPNPQFYDEAGLMDITMINGWNIYMGWYHYNLDSVGSFLDKYYKMHPDKALFISEYGAGSDTRIHTNNPTIYDFSTEYQEKFHKMYLKEGNKRDFVAGFAIWNFIDFQREGRGDAMPQINSKGVVTTDRTPKDVYYMYQAYWSKKDMVHIAAKDWTKRIEVVENINNPVNQPITVYSNTKEVELFINGKSLGKKPTVLHEANWNVPFINGINQLEAVVRSNGKIIKDFLEIEMNLITENITKGIDLQQGLCINVGQTRTNFIDNLTQEVWIPGRKYSENSFGNIDGATYTKWSNMLAWDGIREGVSKNIIGTDIDPIFQTFLIGINEYRFDLPKGEYTISLYFAEPFGEEKRLKPDEKTGADSTGERIFNVYINNNLVINELNLAKEYGELTAVIKDFKIQTANEGIVVRFEPVKGEAVLNGIKIK